MTKEVFLHHHESATTYGGRLLVTATLVTEAVGRFLDHLAEETIMGGGIMLWNPDEDYKGISDHSDLRLK